MLKKWQRLLVVVPLVTIVILVLNLIFNSYDDLEEIENRWKNSKLQEKDGYDWIFNPIKMSNPKISELKLKGERAKEKFATDDDFKFSKDYLESLLNINQNDFKKLQLNHRKYLDSIKNDKKHEYFHSSAKPAPKGSGIVFVGGIKFTWLAMIGIEQLRSLGCDLPIEVFIGTEDDYEADFCENLLPMYNGKCTYLKDEIPNLNSKIDVKISGYQYKLFSILVSEFENILFLDADNVPVRDPTPLLESKIFKKTGLVIWPDAWARTTNPKYYNIAGIKVTKEIVRGEFRKFKSISKLNLNTEVNFHDFKGTLPNPSSESGMILINKKTHAKTLLLSLYYNIYGPKVYYSIFTQGSAGEGDKETFIAAATVLDKPYYQVMQPFKFIGYHYDNKFNSKALGQADPIQDYENYLTGTRLDANNKLAPSPEYVEPKVYFMHLSYPKLVPFALLNDKEIIKQDGTHVRMYLGIANNAGYDFELKIFEIIASGLCKKYRKSKLKPMSAKVPLFALRLKEYAGQNPDTLCPPIIRHVQFLRSNPEP